ncbi:hypothetical protein CDD80_6816 [Ophiocordyceps camponoti-rufipedis]|uniref:WLM domain-containing protein n=1 Tax=Ophiocordyceps camponoti-rufipedis TaxID=2004952 RepID=A0A2C5ZF20_9HYPO|nr:hypothetical protein CDD80_6816 [Ophiocordyceps camponoti-rufipedis]
MPEHEPLVRSYVHLDRESRADEALHTLRKVASLVKPIMRARGWRVGQLAEFYPSDPSLLGLNVNGGSKICLRLRYPGDRTQFMPMENVTDTMLHELCHIVHGPHNQQFHTLWDQLRDELQGLMMKGYTGEGFLSQGRRLGGARIPEHEARRLAREAAERRRRQFQPAAAAPGRRLGGTAPRHGDDIRSVIVDAVQRRNKVLRGCATEKLTEREMYEVAESAARNGFRTQAEEDEANEVAISQALWELVQEDEKKRLGSAYVSPCVEQPGSFRGGPPASTTMTTTTTSSEPVTWMCGTCTLRNPEQFLCCDACGGERPPPAPGPRPTPAPTSTSTSPAPAPAPAPVGRRRKAAAGSDVVVDLTQSPSRSQRARDETAPRQLPPTWTCSFCGMIMERQWWTLKLEWKSAD